MKIFRNLLAVLLVLAMLLSFAACDKKNSSSDDDDDASESAATITGVWEGEVNLFDYFVEEECVNDEDEAIIALIEAEELIFDLTVSFETDGSAEFELEISDKNAVKFAESMVKATFDYLSEIEEDYEDMTYDEFYDELGESGVEHFTSLVEEYCTSDEFEYVYKSGKLTETDGDEEICIYEVSLSKKKLKIKSVADDSDGEGVLANYLPAELEKVSEAESEDKSKDKSKADDDEDSKPSKEESKTESKNEAKKLVGTWEAEVDMMPLVVEMLSEEDGMEDIMKYFDMDEFIIVFIWEFDSKGNYEMSVFEDDLYDVCEDFADEYCHAMYEWYVEDSGEYDGEDYDEFYELIGGEDLIESMFESFDTDAMGADGEYEYKNGVLSFEDGAEFETDLDGDVLVLESPDGEYGDFDMDFMFPMTLYRE